MTIIRFSLLVTVFCISFSSCRRFEQEKSRLRELIHFCSTNLYPIERLLISTVCCASAIMLMKILNFLTFIDEIFHQELAQERIFETIRIDSNQLKEKFGQKRISSSGILPKTSSGGLKKCQMQNGVLFG